MCGETFSSKFTPDQKAAAAKAHPLARPGRWSVVYYAGSNKDDPRHFDEHERAYFDQEPSPYNATSPYNHNGYATKAEAEAALGYENEDHDGFVLPPLEESGDHRIRGAVEAGEVSQEDLLAFVDAVLNNRQAQFEPLRERFAAASLVSPPPAPPAPKLTRAEAAQALVSVLVPGGADSAEAWNRGYGSGPGNAVTFHDFSDEDDQQEGEPVFDSDGVETDQVYYAFDPHHSRKIHAAVKAYFEAEEDAPVAPAAEPRLGQGRPKKPRPAEAPSGEAEEERWGLFATPGDGREPGSLFHGWGTVIRTREQAEKEQRRHGGRVARIVRGPGGDGWVEKKS